MQHPIYYGVTCEESIESKDKVITYRAWLAFCAGKENASATAEYAVSQGREGVAVVLPVDYQPAAK